MFPAALYDPGVAGSLIYRIDRMARGLAREDDPSMHLSLGSSTSKRPADNELYDRGCDLVEAATAIRGLAEDPGATRAAPALLGCVEAALHELGCAVSSLDEAIDHATPQGAMSDRLHRGYMNLGLALADAEIASTAARGLAGLSVAAASRGRPIGPPAQAGDPRDSTRPEAR